MERIWRCLWSVDFLTNHGAFAICLRSLFCRVCRVFRWVHQAGLAYSIIESINILYTKIFVWGSFCLGKDREDVFGLLLPLLLVLCVPSMSIFCSLLLLFIYISSILRLLTESALLLGMWIALDLVGFILIFQLLYHVWMLSTLLCKMTVAKFLFLALRDSTMVSSWILLHPLYEYTISNKFVKITYS